jgi:uncharacterized protein (DUF488 family)
MNYEGAIIPNTVYTIGHSNLKFDEFLKLLNTYKIQVVVDVRSVPYSKYAFEFNKEDTNSKLQNSGIDYLYLGDKLGGIPKDEKYYVDVERSYDLIEENKEYQEGISRLMKIAGPRRTAIMCSEENPDRCHRHHLIAQTLLRKGVIVFHIRKDKTIEPAKREDIQLTLE